MLIDTHAHLTDDRFRADLPEVVARAADAGVARIVDVGDTPASSKDCVEHAGRFAGVCAAVGIHPHHAGDGGAEAFEEIAALAEEPAVVAVGETGMDFHRDRAPRKVQERLFLRHLDLAGEKGLPVIIHCRSAYERLLPILGERSAGALRGVVHCFSGSRADADFLVEREFYISVGGPLTYPSSAGLRETFAGLPLDNILLETDCPYLAPQARRGRRNEPAHIAYVADELARLRGMSRGEVERITTENALRLFKKIRAAHA